MQRLNLKNQSVIENAKMWCISGVSRFRGKVAQGLGWWKV